MKKTIFLILCFIASALLFGANYVLSDNAGILRNEEKTALEMRLNEVSGKTGLSLGIVTDTSNDGMGDQKYADDFSDNNLEGEDSVLLFLNMGERSVYISTAGYGMYAVDDRGEEVVFDAMMNYLSSSDWYGAFDTFALSVKELALDSTFSDYSETTYDYRSGNFEEKEEEKAFDWALVVFVALAVGIPAGFITTAILKGKMKSEGLVGNAEDYVVPQTFVLDKSRDIYLYSTLTKVPRPKNDSPGRGGIHSSSGHMSSAGRIHGGGGRKF